MSGMHDHHHHGSVRVTGAADRRLLAVSLGLLLAFMVAEVVFGILASSLALLADAGHMLTDAAALALALLAASLAARPAAGRWTFGFGRVEILAAQANGITLLLFGLWIVYEAVKRLIDPPAVDAAVVGIVALAGIVVNLIVVALLSRARRQSLNVRGAYLHIATDLAAFVGTGDSNGFGVTNHMKNGPAGNDGPTFNEISGGTHGIGHLRSEQTGAQVSANTGIRGRLANVNNIVSGQGSPTDVADWGPINDNGGK